MASPHTRGEAKVGSLSEVRITWETNQSSNRFRKVR